MRSARAKGLLELKRRVLDLLHLAVLTASSTLELNIPTLLNSIQVEVPFRILIEQFQT